MKGMIRSVIGLGLGVALAAFPTTSFAQSKHPGAAPASKPAPAVGAPGWISPEPLPPDAPVVVCFAQGTDPAYVEAVNTLVSMRNQALFGSDFYVGSSGR